MLSNKRFGAFAAAVAAVLVLALFVALAPTAPAAAQTTTACYRPVGGASFECADGGSFVVQDGAELVVESGGTLTLEAGSTAALGPDIVAAVSDMTLTTITATTGIIDDITAAGAVSAADLSASDDLVVGDDVTIGGSVVITGATGIIGNVDVTGNVEVVDHLLTQAEFYMIPPAAQTVVNGGTITGTGAVVEITSAAEVTATMVQPSDGQLLILVNVGSNVINISEDGTTNLATAGALGAKDTLTLIGTGVTWYEIARSNN